MDLLARAIAEAPKDYRPLQYALTSLPAPAAGKRRWPPSRVGLAHPRYDHASWYRAAALAAFLGEGDRYDQICRQMEVRFASSDDLTSLQATLLARQSQAGVRSAG